MSTCPVLDGKMKFSDLESILRSKTGEELHQDDIDLIHKSISQKDVLALIPSHFLCIVLLRI